jgi:hypothetical protein
MLKEGKGKHLSWYGINYNNKKPFNKETAI